MYDKVMMVLSLVFGTFMGIIVYSVFISPRISLLSIRFKRKRKYGVLRVNDKTLVAIDADASKEEWREFRRLCKEYQKKAFEGKDGIHSVEVKTGFERTIRE